jgi:hypothetical protein
MIRISRVLLVGIMAAEQCHIYIVLIMIRAPSFRQLSYLFCYRFHLNVLCLLVDYASKVNLSLGRVVLEAFDNHSSTCGLC